MLVRPQVIFAAAGTAQPRNKLGATGIQVYSPGAMFWSKKSLILRNAPYTIENPHIGQIEARLNFGDHARANAGARGFERGLPKVAARLQDALSGWRTGWIRANTRPDREGYIRWKTSIRCSRLSWLRKLLHLLMQEGSKRW